MVKIMRRRQQRRLIGSFSGAGVSRLFESCERSWMAVDTETTGLDHRGKRGVDRLVEPARPFMATMANPDGGTAWLRWPVDALTRTVVPPTWTDGEFAAFARELADESLPKVLFNAPFDLRMLRSVGLEVKGEIFDALLALHVVRPDLFDYGLKPVSESMLGLDSEDESALDKSAQRIRGQVSLARRRMAAGKQKPGDAELAAIMTNPSDEDEAYKADFWLADQDLCLRYGVKDAFRTAALWQALVEAMDEDAAKPDGGSRMWETFRMEQALQRHVMRMEDKGIAIDEPRVEELVRFYEELEQQARDKIVEEVGEDFNPRSNPQMIREFFGNRGHVPIKYIIPKGKKTPTPCQCCKGKGCKVCQNTGHNPKCDGDFLAKIGVRREMGDGGEDVLLPNDTLAYHLLRMKASKAMGDFARTYRDMKVLHGDVWALHPNYRQAEAITLRMSCGKPNLQNVADDDSGKKKIDVPYRPREAFVPRPGCVILAPDYSQIEMWILMLRSGDSNLRKILLAGGDTHGRIAHNIWSSDFDLEQALKDKKRNVRDLKPAQLHNLKAYTNRRKRSKNIQFCKIYGGGPAKIGEMIGCTTGEAKQFISDWERMFPEVAGWMDEKVHTAKRHGWSENAFGYRIPVDKDLAYRAVNYDIQCSAAFVLKRAMIRVGELSQEKLWLGRVDPLLTVHDELLIETKVEPETAEMMRLMRGVTAAMQADYKVLGCPVPFPVGMKIVETRWAEAKEVAL